MQQKNNYHLAIDIGASSGRHILGYEENGILKTEEIYRFQNGPVEKAGTAGALGATGAKRLTWDAARLYSEILNGLKRAKELGKIPATVGIDTWGVDYVLLDENDEVIGDVYAYRDGRTKNTVPSVHKRIPFAELYQKTGIQFAQYNTVYQLYDDVRTGKAERAVTYMNLPDYFHFRLTGVKKQEYTMATTTAMVNAVTHEFDTEIFEKLGYKKSMFLPLAQPGSYVGEFTDETEKIVGYKAKVVLPATHDTASAVLAAPLKNQTPYISSGTWSILGVERNAANVSKQAFKMNYSNEGSVNGQFRLQQNIMGLWIIQQIRHELKDKYDFATLASLARLKPDGRAHQRERRKIPRAGKHDRSGYRRGGQNAFRGRHGVPCVQFAGAQLCGIAGRTGKTDGRNVRYAEHYRRRQQKHAVKRADESLHGQTRDYAGPTEGTAIGNLMMQMIGCGELTGVEAGREMIARSFDVTEV